MTAPEIIREQERLAQKDKRVGWLLLIVFAPGFLLLLLVHFFLYLSAGICIYALFRLFRCVWRRRLIRQFPMYAGAMLVYDGQTLRAFSRDTGVPYPQVLRTVRSMLHLGFFKGWYLNTAQDRLCMIAAQSADRPVMPKQPVRETPQPEKKYSAVVVCPSCGARNRITGDEACAYCSTPLEYPRH